GDDFPGVAPYLAPRIVGAAFCPGAGWVNPRAATMALAEAAAEAGGCIRRGVELLRLDTCGAAFVAETSAGAIKCRLVVDAAGSSAGRVAAMVGAELPVMPRPQNMIVTEAAPATIPHLVQHIGRRLTLKQVSNGNIVIGGGLPGRPTANGVTVMREILQTSLTTAFNAVPMIGGLRLLRSWAGEALITDGNPILGEYPPVAGFHFAVPSSSGYTTGPISARLLAEVLLGGRPSDDLRRFSIDRFGDPDR
ncbi:MAG: FAD-dependent oxidoreductase, partial [Rhodobacteraceae bacterium]|nr:FAD-dependent oxidoreductase [Paracoccaceae bacterium]